MSPYRRIGKEAVVFVCLLAATSPAKADGDSLKKVGARTYKLVVKKGGKVLATGKIVYAKDGKSRVVTSSGKSADGKRFRSSSVYDKM